MRTGAEVKVGAIFLVAIALLVVIVYYVMGVAERRGSYTVDVLFDNAQGIEAGSPVRLAGVRVGQVAAVRFDAKAGRARATLRLERKARIYSGYRIAIATGALVGEEVVEIIPVRPAGATRVRPGETLEGGTTASVGDLVDSAQQLVNRLEQTAAAANALVSNEQITKTVEMTLKSLQTLAVRMEALSGVVTHLTPAAEQAALDFATTLKLVSTDMVATSSHLRQVIATSSAPQEMEETARALHSAMERVDEIAAVFESMVKEPALRARLEDTLEQIHKSSENVRVATERAVAITENLRDASEDVKAMTGQARETMPRITRIVGKAEFAADAIAAVASTRVSPRIDMLYSTRSEQGFADANVDLYLPGRGFLRLGAANLGVGAQANVQLGRQQGRNLLRYGIIRSQLGVGYDLSLWDRTRLSVDLLDVNDPRVDALLRYQLAGPLDQVSLVGGIRDGFRQDLPVFGIGYGR